MKNKILILYLISLFCLTSTYSQQDDSINSNEDISEQNADLEDLVREQRKQEIVTKYDLSLETALTAKLLSEGAIHLEPDLSSPVMDFTIKRSESVYAYKYFIDQRCWLINYKSSWGFIEDYLIMAVKEQDNTSYKDQWDAPPKIKTSIKPKYPKEAKDAGLEGSVEVKIFINEKGQVTQTIILKGIDGLNDAAIEAINKAKFEPAKKNGKKTGVWVPTRIKFTL